MRAITKLSCSLFFLLWAVGPVSANHCPTHPNVILILADDFWWGDLPWYSPPIAWQNDPDPVFETAVGTGTAGYRMQQPTLNRFAARALASNGMYGVFPNPPENPLGVPTTTLSSGLVRPIDDQLNEPGEPNDYEAEAGCLLAATTSKCRGSECSSTACDRRRDILDGAGGFKRIVDGGAVFGRYYATSAFCGPARGSLITGRHTKRTGVGSNGGVKLKSEEVFISEWLRQGCPTKDPNPVPPLLSPDKCYLKPSPANPDPCASYPCYHTGYVGKWHLGVMPWEQGFRESAVGLSSARAYFLNQPLHCRGIAGCDSKGDLHILGGQDKPSSWPCNNDSDVSTNQPNGCSYSPRVFERIAETFIDGAIANANQGKSDAFFLVISLNAVHVPRSAPKRTVAHYNTTSNAMLDVKARDKGDVYWAVVEEIDAAIGKLYDRLDYHQIVDDTVVLFTSDHGGPERSYGLPTLRGGKGGVGEGGARVGLLASACGHPVGDRSSHVANHADLFPTIAEAAGAAWRNWDQDGGPDPMEKARPIDGISFYSVLNGGTAHLRDYSFGRYHGEIINAAPGVNPDPVGNNRVCGYSGLSEFNVPVRGATCTPCANAGACASKPCKVLGKVCIPDTQNRGTCNPANVNACANDPTLASCNCNEDLDCVTSGGVCFYPPSKLRRCLLSIDCNNGNGESCKDGAHVECNECPPPSWKLRTPPDVDNNPTTFDLYELTTNPEEMPELDCNKLTNDPATPINESTMWETVRNELHCRIKKWYWCTADDGIGGDRDDSSGACNAVCDRWGEPNRTCDNGTPNDYCSAISSTTTTTLP